MKCQITIIACLLFNLTAHAQNISGSYQAKADGEIQKQQIEYVAVDSTGQEMLWDLSEIELPEHKETVNYSAEDSRKGIVIGRERNTRYYYRPATDSLLLTGYENNLQRVEYDQPELLLHMPLVYGSCYDGFFHGTSAYCEKVFSRIFGSYRVEVDGTGVMLLPTGDTLRHVSRVHLTELSAYRYYPEMGTVRMLKTYVDSVAFTADSIRMGLAVDSLVTERHIYRWYAAGYRYPIVEVTTTGPKGEEPLVAEAFYCSPEVLAAIDDEENEEIRRMLAANSSSSYTADREIADREVATRKDNHNGMGEDTAPDNESVLQHVNISVVGSTVTVGYELAQDATVKAMVCNVSGMTLRQASQSGQSDGSNMLTVNCSGLRRGEYVLYLNVNGKVTSYTINF